MNKDKIKQNLLVFLFVVAILSMIFTIKALAFNHAPINARSIDAFEIPRIISFNDASAEEMSLEDLKSEISYWNEVKESAKELENYAFDLGWPNDCNTILNARNEYANASIIQNFYSEIFENKQAILQEMRLDKKATEFPEATFIWRYMKNLGWNDYICAGIMGNLMVETGGGTLELDSSAGTSYYGICQWNKNHKKVQNTSLSEQCDYLRDTIKYEFDTFGYAYKNNFDFNSFLNLTDERAAALAFAKCYERCSSKTYNLRQEKAEVAYNYFVD